MSNRREFVKQVLGTSAAAAMPTMALVPLSQCKAGEDVVMVSPQVATKMLAESLPQAEWPDIRKVLADNSIKGNPDHQELMAMLHDILSKVDGLQKAIGTAEDCSPALQGFECPEYVSPLQTCSLDYVEEIRRMQEETQIAAQPEAIAWNNEHYNVFGPATEPSYEAMVEYQKLLQLHAKWSPINVLTKGQHAPAFLIKSADLEELQRTAAAMPSEVLGYKIYFHHVDNLQTREATLRMLTTERLVRLLNAAWQHDSPAILREFDVGFEEHDMQHSRLAVKTVVGAVADEYYGGGPFTALRDLEGLGYLKEENERYREELNQTHALHKLAQELAQWSVKQNLALASHVRKVTYDQQFDQAVVIFQQTFHDGSQDFVRFGGTLAQAKDFLQIDSPIRAELASKDLGIG